MNNIIKSISSIIIIATLITTNAFCNEKSIIAGEDRFETAIEISKSWKTSREAILVNLIAESDLLCATVLASQIDCPILLTDKNNINEPTSNEIKRLNINKLYLIGGKDVIYETIEKELNKSNIKTERICGVDRYETSISIANKVSELKKSNIAILVNGEYSVADAVSISPIAGDKNIPVIICKNDQIKLQKEWMKNNDIKNLYIIGGEDVINKAIEKELNIDNINIERIYGKDRYETNAKIIENFYKEVKINKLFYCKGKNLNKKNEIIDGMLVSPLASKEKSPIILLGENLTKEQKYVIKKKNIKSLIQVGHGVSEESKKELYKLKESYTSPSLDDSLTLNPSQPEEPPSLEQEDSSDPKEEPPILEPEQPNKPEEEPPILEQEKPSEPEEEPSIPELPPIENEKEDLKYVDYTIDEKKKIISINFNKEIYTSKESIKELKESIKIIIDKNNIYNNKIEKNKNTENNLNYEEKYIKLNKYDNVKIEGKSLIIELDDEPIGNNSSIVISGDTIKDDDNSYLEELRVENIQGINKNIAFVKNEDELNEYINDKEVDIIKLENDIVKSKNINTPIKLKDNITIDGSNGEENFKIYHIENSLQQILMSSNNITLKNLDLEGIYIDIINRQNIILKNMKIDLDNKKIPSSTRFTPCITVDYSEVYAKDIILINNESAIEVKSTSATGKRATLIIDGYVYNEKTDKENKYMQTIILENRTKDINSENLNKVILKDENKKIEDMFIKEIKNNNEDVIGSNKTYEIYYKK
nr:cell wall-binding repeat-containing protein [uncultured Romboutsia sp.]